MNPHVRRTVITAIKLALGAAILAYLIYKGHDAFRELSTKTIDWTMLGAALAATFAMVMLNIVRWHILILALGFDTPFVQTVRLGAIGFALNFISPGSIGGDFFK